MILRLWDSLRAARPLCCLIYMSNIVRMFLELKENKEADRSRCLIPTVVIWTTERTKRQTVRVLGKAKY